MSQHLSSYIHQSQTATVKLKPSTQVATTRSCVSGRGPHQRRMVNASRVACWDGSKGRWVMKKKCKIVVFPLEKRVTNGEGCPMKQSKLLLATGKQSPLSKDGGME